MLGSSNLFAEEVVMDEFHHELIQATVELGKIPYRFGGNDQDVGLDCSSYIQKIYENVGIELPRSARDQVNDGRFETVKLAQRNSGDLIFFKNTYRRGVSHVGIFIDEHYFAHASSGDKQIVIENFDKSPYFKKRFFKLKRLKTEYRTPASIKEDIAKRDT